MDLTHRFTVPASIDDTWAAFNNLEAIAPCFPGATIDSVDGDDFAGSVKVKLGPIALLYRGTGKFIERDIESHRAVIEARGKDKRGNGTASAKVQATLTAEGDKTAVEVITDLSITGKPAQFGRGVMQDVSDKLLGVFVSCVSDQFAGVPAVDDPVVTGTSADDENAGEPAAASTSAGLEEDPDALEETPIRRETSESATPGSPVQANPAGSEGAGSTGAPRSFAPPSSSSADLGGLNLLSTVGPVLLRRYGPFVVAGIGLFVIILHLSRRSRSAR